MTTDNETQPPALETKTVPGGYLPAPVVFTDTNTVDRGDSEQESEKSDTTTKSDGEDQKSATTRKSGGASQK